MKKKFRVSKNDTIKATASGKNGLLSTVYDSGFTTINQVVGKLISKIPYYSGKSIEISIYIIDKQTVKYITKKVNKQHE